MICQGHRKIDNNSARRLAESAELHIACSGRVQCSSVPSAVSIHGGILGQMACFPGGLTCVYREMHCVASAKSSSCRFLWASSSSGFFWCK